MGLIVYKKIVCKNLLLISLNQEKWHNEFKKNLPSETEYGTKGT